MPTLPRDDPQRMDLKALIDRCRRETERFFQHDISEDRYCFELFRRAIVNDEQLAWEGIFSEYSGMVARWVQDHPNFKVTGEEVQYFVNRAFENIARSLKRPGAFANFSTVDSLLAYLKKCVRSAVRDALRKSEQAPIELPLELVVPDDENVGQQIIQREQSEIVWRLVNARLQNEKERLVLEGYFVFGLMPRKIFTLHSHVFNDVLEIHRIKQNLLERLKRDSELRNLWQEDA